MQKRTWFSPSGKTLAHEESNRRVEQLLNTGYDVLIIVSESIISKRTTADGRRGTLYIRSCEQGQAQGV